MVTLSNPSELVKRCRCFAGLSGLTVPRAPSSRKCLQHTSRLKKKKNSYLVPAKTRFGETVGLTRLTGCGFTPVEIIPPEDFVPCRIARRFQV